MEFPQKEMINDYENGLTTKQMKNKYHIGYEHLSKIIAIKNRSLSKVRIDLRPSKELWYVIGVLFGDGSAYSYRHHQCKNAKFYRIELDTKDREFADEFVKCCKLIRLNPFLATRKLGGKEKVKEFLNLIQPSILRKRWNN